MRDKRRAKYENYVERNETRVFQESILDSLVELARGAVLKARCQEDCGVIDASYAIASHEEVENGEIIRARHQSLNELEITQFCIFWAIAQESFDGSQACKNRVEREVVDIVF